MGSRLPKAEQPPCREVGLGFGKWAQEVGLTWRASFYLPDHEFKSPCVLWLFESLLQLFLFPRLVRSLGNENQKKQPSTPCLYGEFERKSPPGDIYAQLLIQGPTQWYLSVRNCSFRHAAIPSRQCLFLGSARFRTRP